MKSTSIATRPILSPPRPSSPQQLTTPNNQAILFGLMIPFVMVILNLTMFGIALPTIRDTFKLQADVVAWLATGYMLPFMIAMPLYGRLGDELGKRRLFLFGISIFLIGTLVASFAPSFAWLLLGRAIQGWGAASVVPLSMALISQTFPLTERGKALGTWNSVGPLTGALVPFGAGLLIDHFAWQTIYIPILLITLVSIWAIRTQVPQSKSDLQISILRNFDWGGVIFLTLTMTTLTFYLSSQAITGVATLYDGRLLGASLLFLLLFLLWERRQAKPYVPLSFFLDRTFSQASLCAGTRMFVMSGVSFIIPLYLWDIHHLSAASTGLILMLHSFALLITIRLGGQLADRWNGRYPVIIGVLGQLLLMSYFAILPATTALPLVAAGLVLHGLGAGLSLAPLHRASLGHIPAEQSGMAAGLYSLVRFMGMVLGQIMVGAILQNGLDQAGLPIVAYQTAFWGIAAAALLGLGVGWGLPE